MTKRHRERLEKAGWRVGDAAEFLELSDVEAALVEAKLALGDAVRALRRRSRLSQQDLAKRMGSSQSRVAKVENHDLAFRQRRRRKRSGRSAGRAPRASPPSTSARSVKADGFSNSVRRSWRSISSSTDLHRVDDTEARILPACFALAFHPR